MFAESLKAARISDDECHLVVDSTFTKREKNPGPVSAFSEIVLISIQNIATKLRGVPDYAPFFSLMM